MTVGLACVFPNEELRLSRVCTQGGLGTARLFPADLVTCRFRFLVKAYSNVGVAVVAEVQWISNIVLVSDGPQSDSVSHVQIVDFVYVFRFFST